MSQAQNSLLSIRREVTAAITHALERPVRLSERAAICLEGLVYRPDFYSWQLRLLNGIIETTPAVYNQLRAIDPLFERFDYTALRAPVEKSEYRSAMNTRTAIGDICRDLIEEPDPGLIGVVYLPNDPAPRREVVGDVLTVDHLIELLFTRLYAGEYISDIAMGMLALTGRSLHRGRENRWWLDEFEGVQTHTEQLDPSYSSQQWLLFHDGSDYRIRPFGAWSVDQLSESPLRDGSLWVARSNVLQPPKRFSEDAIAHLEDLINDGAPEAEFQSFFKAHPEFLLALGGYKKVHSQLILHEDGGERLIPDFFLEKVTGDQCDILDLKRANVEILRKQKRRQRFRDAVMEGVAQLEHYRNWFESSRNRSAFEARYGLRAYRPRVTLVIGRSMSIHDEVPYEQTKGLLPGHVELRTYDEIVEQARHYRDLLVSPAGMVETPRL